MTLQNRADPAGHLHAVAGRGLFTGNRGVLHDPDTRTLTGRGWTTMAWIVCDLRHPRALTRSPMGRNARSGGAGWTELFFLDEVTGLAAGHRPCFYCRREAAERFRACFGTGNGIELPRAAVMDSLLHRQRRLSGGDTASPPPSADLPDGTMLEGPSGFFALRGGRLLGWSFAGYKPAYGRERLRLVTPPATLAALRAGYQPVWHPSADA